MPMNPDEVLEAASFVHGIQSNERRDLDVLRLYATGKQQIPMVVPTAAPAEVREMARISRINLIAIVVNSLIEALFVDNLRVPESTDEPVPGVEPVDGNKEIAEPVWKALQANRFDRMQSALYRAVFTYGYGYMVVTAGTPYPVVRALSPRKMTAVYGDGEDWPELALESRGRERYRLYDQTHVYRLGYDPEKKRFAVAVDPVEHGLTYCPVVRYMDAEDLDLDDEPVQGSPRGNGNNTTIMVAGQVAPLMTLQDQQDVTSFGLLSAQWYTAFRQRWVVGWTPETANAKVSAAASQMWTFDADPDEVKLGEFAETTLDGYLRSRESTAKFAATLSQTPVHELIGELVNLSAEALAAAEAGRDRKVDLRKTGLGESHEQLATAIGDLMGIEVPVDLEVVWRDTSARAFGAIVDGLGKLATMLQIPPQMLWDRIPGVTRQDTERWKIAAASGDAIGQLTTMLDKQAAAAATPQPGETTTAGGLILPPGAAR